MDLIPVRWYEADPLRLELELERMNVVASEFAWQPELQGTTGGGWQGLCPVWPFERDRPPQLDNFLKGRRFSAEVHCSPAHPVAVPAVVPVDPVPDLQVRTRQQWHVMGDGSLCLLQEVLEWTGRETTDQLVIKAAGWFLEFLLMQEGRIERMTEAGIARDDSLDYLLVPQGGDG